MGLVTRTIRESKHTARIIRAWCMIMLMSICYTHLCWAGIGKTTHDLHLQNKEKNCFLCHIPHTNTSQHAAWIPKNKPMVEKETISFSLPKDEETLCLSCHDGILAKDMCVITDKELEKDAEIFSIPLDKRYFRIGMLSLKRCEKHYYLLSYYQKQFPPEQLKCSMCHDIHRLKDGKMAWLLEGNVFKKFPVCSNCH